MTRVVIARVKCQGHRRADGEPCVKTAEPGRNFCRFHGGRNPVGMDNGRWKDGRFSRYLPPRLLEKYHESLSDPDLLGLQEQIAIVDSRLAELFAGMDRGESGAWWRSLQRAHTSWTKAQRSEDMDAAKSAFAEMERLIRQGSDLSSTWDDIAFMQNHRRRLVDTERKRIADMHASIPAARAVAFAMAVVGVIRRHVQDRKVLNAIQRDIAGLLSRKDANELPPGRSDEIDRDDDEDDDGD